MFKRPSDTDNRSFFGFIAVFFGTILIVGISSNNGINSTKPARLSASHQEKATEPVKHFETAQHFGDEADQYADNLLSHFRSGGVCDTYSSTIRRVADTGSSVNIRVTKMHKIMDKAHKNNCVRY
jgi:hypothetical protein